jgi:hypothetical protein
MPRVAEAAAVPSSKLLVSGQLKLMLLEELHASHVKLWNFFQIYNSDPVNLNAYIKNWSAQKSYKESLEHALLAYEF